MDKSGFRRVAVLTGLLVACALSMAAQGPALTLGLYEYPGGRANTVGSVTVAACKLVQVQARASGGTAPFTYAFDESVLNRPCHSDGRCTGGLPCGTQINAKSGVIAFRIPDDATMAGVVCGPLTVKVTDAKGAVAKAALSVTYGQSQCAGKIAGGPGSNFTALSEVCQLVGCNGAHRPWADKVDPAPKVAAAMQGRDQRATTLQGIRKQAIQLTDRMQGATPASARQIETTASQLLQRLRGLGF